MKQIKITQSQIIQSVIDYENGITLECIAKKLGTNYSHCRKVLLENGLKTRKASETKRKHKLKNERFFEIIDSEDKAYFLGLLYSDGNVNISKNRWWITTLELQDRDKYIIEELKNRIYEDPAEFPLTHRKRAENHREMFRLKISSRKMVEDLIKNGCVERKCHVIRLPKLTKNLMPHFIRGYFDGDGCISVSLQGKSTYSNLNIYSNKEFCLDLQQYFKENLDIKSGVYRKSKDVNIRTCQLKIGTHNSQLKFYKFIYSNDSNLFLTRKKEKLEEFLLEKNLKLTD